MPHEPAEPLYKARIEVSPQSGTVFLVVVKPTEKVTHRLDPECLGSLAAQATEVQNFLKHLAELDKNQREHDALAAVKRIEAFADELEKNEALMGTFLAQEIRARLSGGR
jgi:hypothetical protein